jgi:hypothetical protein
MSVLQTVEDWEICLAEGRERSGVFERGAIVDAP